MDVLEQILHRDFLDTTPYESDDLALIPAVEFAIVALSRYPQATEKLLAFLDEAYRWSHEEDLKTHRDKAEVVDNGREA